MSLYYTLDDNHQPQPCTMMQWAAGYEERTKRGVKSSRHVDLTVFKNGTRVSTVFLGMDHGWGDGEPVLFETMIFDGPHDGYMERYYTWDEAIQGHQRAVKLAKPNVFALLWFNFLKLFKHNTER